MRRKSQRSIVKGQWILFFTFYFLLFTSSIFSQTTSPKYEFRGAWIATIANIDWPSNKGLSGEAQKTEFINILNRLQRDGINAVIVQIRPNADAFYDSKIEPWSEYLTGRQGVAPEPFYDPLKFMIDEAHKRGMEFHAWINPYRAVFNLKTNSIAPDHVTKMHPDWFVTYGNAKYFNPGLPEVQLYLEGVVRDIITRYDIDGLHMDDYFYPYKIDGKEFADNAAYLRYGRGLSKDEWRRSNCDSIVKYIHEIIIAAKPTCKFGISPFGVWRNKSHDINGSDTRAGTDDYDGLYANILLWLKEGWIDYVAPQLYWEIGNPLCDFETLVNWWADHSYGKQVYIGHAVYKVYETNVAAYKTTNELPNEISFLRKNNNVHGSVFFSTKDLLRDPNGWEDSLQNNYYKTPALIPPMPWIDTTTPAKPQLVKVKFEKDFGNDIFKIEGKIKDDNELENIKSYVVYFSKSLATLGSSPTAIIPSINEKSFSFNINTSQLLNSDNHYFVAITCVNRTNNESALSNVIQLQRTENGWEIMK